MEKQYKYKLLSKKEVKDLIEKGSIEIKCKWYSARTCYVCKRYGEGKGMYVMMVSDWCNLKNELNRNPDYKIDENYERVLIEKSNYPKELLEALEKEADDEYEEYLRKTEERRLQRKNKGGN